jgi:hypothetical protein
MSRLLGFALLAGCAGDCSDMKLLLIENDSEPSRDQRVGVGLTLYVDVYVHKSGFPVNPENLAVIADAPDTVDVNIGAIPVDRSGQAGTSGYHGKPVGLTPLAPGDNGFVFIADNTDETIGLSYEAMPVTEVRYLDATNEPIPNGSSWFLDTEFQMFMEYRSNDTRVAGTSALDAVVPPDAGFAYVMNPYVYDETDPVYFFDLGAKPYSATFATIAAPQTLSINVVDTTGIASLRTDIPLGRQSLSLVMGRSERFTLIPIDAMNQPILGTTYDRATAAVTAGTAAKVSTIFAGGEVVVDPVEVGQSTLTFTWGTATIDIVVDVTAPAM